VKTPFIIALAVTLVGCSRQPPHQAAAESCTEKHGFACSNRTAAAQPVKLASFKTKPLTKEAKFTIAAQMEKPSSHRARYRAHLATKKAKPTVIAAKAQPPATRIPMPPPLETPLEPKSSAADAGSGTTGPNIPDSRATAGPAPNSNDRTIQEQVAAATVVAERMTVATVGATRDGAEPIAGASPNIMVAVVMVRPEIRSVSDLVGRTIAIDDRYSASSTDVRVAIMLAGGPLVQLSAGHTTAIDRLVNGEVPAAVLALVSAEAAEGFPEIRGFRTLHFPLSTYAVRK
jgi:hypothetical protein